MRRKDKQKRPKRNYLLLGASFLIVGLIIEYATMRLLSTQLNVVYKTFMVMLMIVLGYSFAEAVIARSARGSLQILQKPFVRFAGSNVGKPLFYIVVYGVLFVLYLLVFIYGLDVSSIPQPAITPPDLDITNITA